jgi:lipopolysaccharide/colanic/teichoic acid biosynthesis glycosyltransferase
LHSIKHFSAILERERMRADRAGSNFSLLLISSQAPKGLRGEELAVVAELLTARLRSVDEAGYWRKRVLGAMLPATPPSGARKLAGDLCSLLSQRSIQVDCEVYEYPSRRPSDREEGGEGEIQQQDPSPAPAAGLPGILESPGAEPVEALLAAPLPAWKRALDVIGASVGLALLSPLLAVVAVAIKLTSPGPVFFRQRRDGLGGKPFMMIKFRTMYEDAEARKAQLLHLSEQDGPAFKMAEDPRVTPLGRFLRRTCIDELPQLWHVLRGEMSLVGPRPMDSKESQECTPWQRRRLDVTPGVTCIWQAHGGREVSFADWMRMDIRYASRRTVWQDVKLIWHTLLAVICRRASV